MQGPRWGVKAERHQSRPVGCGRRDKREGKVTVCPEIQAAGGVGMGQVGCAFSWMSSEHKHREGSQSSSQESAGRWRLEAEARAWSVNWAGHDAKGWMGPPGRRWGGGRADRGSWGQRDKEELGNKTGKGLWTKRLSSSSSLSYS